MVRVLGVLGFLVLLVSISHSAEGAGCQLPDQLNNADVTSDFWYGKPAVDGESYHVTINTKTSVAVFQLRMGSTVKKNLTATCTDYDKKKDMYKFKYTDGTSPETYRCVSLDIWNGNIVHVKGSMEENKAITNCTGKPMTDDYMLVSNIPKDFTNHKCPWSAQAYSVQMTVFPENKTLCDKNYVTLEAECSAGEGLQFNFMEPSCVPGSTGWGIETSFDCMGKKTDDKYIFTMLNIHGHYQPYWCLRQEKANLNKIVIFLDLVCTAETTDNSSYIQMDLEKTKLSLTNTDTKTDCSFDNASVIVGEYFHESRFPTPSKNVNITAKSVSVTDVKELTCSTALDQNTYVLTATPQGGCKQRYTCGKFLKAGPTAQATMLGVPITTDSPYVVCDSSVFQGDLFQQANPLRARNWQVLVPSDAKKMKPDPSCKNIFNGIMLNIAATDASGNDCQGVLNGCKADEFQVDWNCTSQNRTTSDYQCIGSVPKTRSSAEVIQYIIAETLASGPVFRCLIMTGQQPNYVMTNSQCNSETLGRIQLGLETPLVTVTNATVSGNCPTGTPSTSVPVTTSGQSTHVTVPTTTSGHSNTTGNVTGTTGIISNTTVLPYTTGIISNTTVLPYTTAAWNETTTAAAPTAGGLSSGAKAAVVIVVLLAFGAVCVVGYLVYKRKKHPSRVPYSHVDD